MPLVPPQTASESRAAYWGEVVNVRFANACGKIRLYVVPETDADRVALEQFVAGLGDGTRAVVVEVNRTGGHGFDGCNITSLGPSFLAFDAAQVTVGRK